MKRALLITTSALLFASAPAWATHRPGHQPGTGNLNAAANPFLLTFGSATTVSGKLTGRNNSGQRVTLAEDPFPFGDGFADVANATTSGNGNYSFRLVPAGNRNYRVRARGEEAFTGVRVRIRVTLFLGDYTPRIGQLVRFSGFAFPKHDGRAVLIQRLTATGAWVTVRRTLLRVSTATRSSFATILAIRRSTRYRALVGSDGDHVTGTSASRFARVG
jgi:hypothetical protein